MYYELYIDVFFLENFMADSLLLLAVGRALKCGRSYVRIVLGGVLGSLLTCLVIVIPFPAAIKLLLFHVAVNSLMIIAGLKITGAGQFVKAFVLLYLSAVVMGGTVQLFRPYFRYAAFFYGAFAAAYVLFSLLWKMAASFQRREEILFLVTLYVNGREKEVTGLWDTGNTLTDPVTGEPVTILAPKLAGEILEGEGLSYTDGFRYIPYRSISGEGIMPVFRGERMCIHTEEECWIMNPLLGVSKVEISSEKNCQMILNPGVLSR